ncbi:glutamic-type intramembrane protease PrsW [Paenibacillus sp. Z6-24]
MSLFSILMAAIAPGIALLVYVYLKDKYDTEPLHLVIKFFLLGIAIVFPIMIIQRAMVLGLGESPYVFSFLISAGVEEAAKWFIIYHMLYNHTEFDEPYDGIVYAVALSLGFATLENVLYALYNSMSVMSLLARGLLPVSGHALFGVIMGYYVGKAKFTATSRKRRLFLACALVLPLFWHGVYDFILQTVTQHWMWYIIPLMLFLWYGGMIKIARANNRSPFRFVKREEEINT